jgi:cell shape-determining protein MreC
MLLWTIRTTIISIILIFLVHHLIVFFTKTLTVPKIKDLVNAPAHKYENIYNSMASSTQSLTQATDYSLNTSNINDLLPPDNDYSQEKMLYQSSNSLEDNTMKNDLKMFLKKQLKAPATSINNDASHFSPY